VVGLAPKHLEHLREQQLNLNTVSRETNTFRCWAARCLLTKIC
jgi:hypothetical protein